MIGVACDKQQPLGNSALWIRALEMKPDPTRSEPILKMVIPIKGLIFGQKQFDAQLPVLRHREPSKHKKRFPNRQK